LYIIYTAPIISSPQHPPHPTSRNCKRFLSSVSYSCMYLYDSTSFLLWKMYTWKLIHTLFTKYFNLVKTYLMLGMVAHVYNCSYLGDGDQRIELLGQHRQNIHMTPFQQIKSWAW
jgi:hypothetical protein